MNVKVNGKQMQTQAQTLFALARELNFDTNEDVLILNGYQMKQEYLLSEGDETVFIKKGQYPKEEELVSMLCARHTPRVYEKIKRARVAVAGLGGLGSNIALNLARTGVGTLHLIDYDVVEPSNLNRQQYGIRHLGMRKTDALKEEISQINPFVQVLTTHEKVTEKNCLRIFSEEMLVCEAFDDPNAKAMLVNCLLSERKDVSVIGASGMAGYASSNSICTKQFGKRFYVCGDFKSEAGPGMGLMAPRVAVCAGHQSNMALRLLLGDEQV